MALTGEDKQWITAQLDTSIERFGGRLTKYILDLREETISGLRALNNRMDVLSSTMTSIDSRVPALTKGVLEAGAVSTQLLFEQSTQKAEFGARLAKLEEAVAQLMKPAA